MLHDDIFLSGLYVMQFMTNFLEHMKVLSSIDGLSLWQKLYPYVLFSDFFEGDVGRDQDNETAVVTHHNAMMKIFAFDSILLPSCEKIFFSDARAPPSANEENIGYKFSYIQNFLSHGSHCALFQSLLPLL